MLCVALHLMVLVKITGTHHPIITSGISVGWYTYMAGEGMIEALRYRGIVLLTTSRTACIVLYCIVLSELYYKVYLLYKLSPFCEYLIDYVPLLTPEECHHSQQLLRHHDPLSTEVYSWRNRLLDPHALFNNRLFIGYLE